MHFVASFESEKEAYEISNEVKEVHKLANFDLRGFVSNSMDIEERLNNATGQLPKATVNIDREKVDKILGMHWESQSDELEYGLYERFKQWISQLANVKHFKLERCYSLHFLDPAVKIDLHVFVDASKTKCAPLKMLSVPRLELQATSEEFDFGKPQRKCRQRHFMVRLEDGHCMDSLGS
ncbi:hypothetical protein ACLKA7_001355 [Drosophila subpalustris]